MNYSEERYLSAFNKQRMEVFKIEMVGLLELLIALLLMLAAFIGIIDYKLVAYVMVLMKFVLVFIRKVFLDRIKYPLS